MKVTMRNISTVMLLSIIDWIIIHFGKNPSIGGSPPNDINDNIIMNFTSVFRFPKRKIWLRKNSFILMKIITIIVFNVE